MRDLLARVRRRGVRVRRRGRARPPGRGRPGGVLRALIDSEPLRNVLTDVAIPPGPTRGVVQRPLAARPPRDTGARVLGRLSSPRPISPRRCSTLVELARETAEALTRGNQVRIDGCEELLGGRTAVRERIRGLRRQAVPRGRPARDASTTSRTRWSVSPGSSSRAASCARRSATRTARWPTGRARRRSAPRQGAAAHGPARRVCAGGRPCPRPRRHARVGRRTGRGGAGTACRRSCARLSLSTTASTSGSPGRSPARSGTSCRATGAGRSRP